MSSVRRHLVIVKCRLTNYNKVKANSLQFKEQNINGVNHERES